MVGPGALAVCSRSGHTPRSVGGNYREPTAAVSLLMRGVNSKSKSKWAASLLLLALAGCGGAASQVSAPTSPASPPAATAAPASPHDMEYQQAFNSVMDLTCTLNQKWINSDTGHPCSSYVVSNLARTAAGNPYYHDPATNPSGFCEGISKQMVLVGAEAADDTAGCNAALAYMASHPGGGEAQYPGSS